MSTLKFTSSAPYCFFTAGNVPGLVEPQSDWKFTIDELPENKDVEIYIHGYAQGFCGFDVPIWLDGHMKLDPDGVIEQECELFLPCDMRENLEQEWVGHEEACSQTGRAMNFDDLLCSLNPDVPKGFYAPIDCIAIIWPHKEEDGVRDPWQAYKGRILWRYDHESLEEVRDMVEEINYPTHGYHRKRKFKKENGLILQNDYSKSHYCLVSMEVDNSDHYANVMKQAVYAHSYAPSKSYAGYQYRFLYPVSCGMWLVAKDPNTGEEKMLLCKQYGTTWSPPKGHMEDGESPIQTAFREVFEETGLVAWNSDPKQGAAWSRWATGGPREYKTLVMFHQECSLDNYGRVLGLLDGYDSDCVPVPPAHIKLPQRIDISKDENTTEYKWVGLSRLHSYLPTQDIEAFFKSREDKSKRPKLDECEISDSSYADEGFAIQLCEIL